MKRREFGEKVVSAAIGVSMAGKSTNAEASAQSSRTPRKNTLMHVGGDYHSVAGPGITSREIWSTTYATGSNTSPCKRRIVRKAAAGTWMH